MQGCPECGTKEFDAERCEGCKLNDLARARSGTEPGKLMSRLLRLDAAAKRFRMDWDEVTAEDARGLEVLDEERARWHREEAK